MIDRPSGDLSVSHLFVWDGESTPVKRFRCATGRVSITGESIAWQGELTLAELYDVFGIDRFLQQLGVRVRDALFRGNRAPPLLNDEVIVEYLGARLM